MLRPAGGSLSARRPSLVSTAATFLRPRFPRKFTSLCLPLTFFVLLFLLPLNKRGDVVVVQFEDALHIPHQPLPPDALNPPSRKSNKGAALAAKMKAAAAAKAGAAANAPKPAAAAAKEEFVLKEDIIAAPPPPPTVHVEHKRLDNGLILIEDTQLGLKGQKHPIEILIAEAKQKAELIEQLTPKSFEDAVKLYKSQTGRNPPLGFKGWYDWCTENEVSTWPYKAVFETILPYLATPGSVLKERLSQLDERVQTVIFDIQDGAVVDTSGTADKDIRAQEFKLLIKPIAHLLPDLKAYINLDDVGARGATYEYIEKSKELAKNGEVWPEDKRLEIENSQHNKHGWDQFCPPTSPVAKGEQGAYLTEDLDLLPKSFVYDVGKSVDHCNHPEFLKMHGTFIFTKPNPDELIPLISISSVSNLADIRGPALDHINSSIAFVPWAAKTEKRVIWRGTTTGTFHSNQINWKSSHRERLHLLGARSSGDTDILVERRDRLERETWKTDILNKKWLDLKFTGGPRQCSKSDGTCDEMDEIFEFSPVVRSEAAAKFRYQLDVDGNGWSARFHRILTSGSAILKSTVYPEFNSELLIPWYHYIPVQVNYSDLYDILSFFEGPPEGIGHSALAEEIGLNGSKFAAEHWRWQDAQSYMILLLLEYARMMSEDRDAMTMTY